MKYCVCDRKHRGFPSQVQESPPFPNAITYTNNSYAVPGGATETIFWMLPGCNLTNSYGFGGVCSELKVAPGESNVFSIGEGEALVKRPGWAGMVPWGYDESRWTKGVVLARINWTPFTISAVFAKEGSTWTSEDFDNYWNAYKNMFQTLWDWNRSPISFSLPQMPWSVIMKTFLISKFRELSNNGQLWEEMKESVKW